MLPNLPNDPTALPLFGKFLVMFGMAVVVATCLLEDKVEFVNSHFIELIIVGVFIALLGFLFVFTPRRAKGP